MQYLIYPTQDTRNNYRCSTYGISLILDSFRQLQRAQKERVRFSQLFEPLKLSFEQADMNLKVIQPHVLLTFTDKMLEFNQLSDQQC